ncbi:MAG: Rne/Rng family ribonuclease [Terriglobia bacterium]
MAKELFISSSPHETKVAILEDSDLVEVYFERDVEAGLVGGIYKGRVRRVLPGMQSAFVDIGLDRDAFLYVSDFFEDSEEYEKVVAEAEARVARYTDGRPAAPLPQAETAAAEQPAESAPLVVTPPATTESAGPTPSAPPTPPSPVSPTSATAPPAESVTVAAAPELTPAAEEAPVLSPAPAGPPSSGRPEDHEHRRHDHRGRRRRHGRRGGFGDQREHRFGPPKPEPRTPPRRDESSPPQGFQLLPGESLARYGQAAPKPEGPAEEVSEAASASTEAARFGVEPQTAPEREPLQKVETEAATPSLPIAFPLTAAAPAVELVAENVAVATETAKPAPIIEPAVQGPAVPPSGMAVESAPAPEVSAVEIEEAEEIAHEPVPFTEAITADWTLDRRSAAAAPTATEAEPSAWAPEAEPGKVEEEQHAAAETEFSGAEGALEVPPEEAMEEEAGETEETEEGADEEAEELAGADEGLQEGLSAEAGQPEAIPAEGAAPSETATPTTGSEERSYTLHDSEQRPRYAPRRGRRGRRGAGQRPFRGPETPRVPRAGNDQPVQISQLLKEGQEILVQIAKEPLGTKGARITSHIALPGRYLVYMPTISHIGVSRKIASEEERLRLRNIILENRGPLTGGFIVRTAGAGRSEEEFKADLRFLSTLWSDIKSRAERGKAPLLLHRDLDLVQRILRDILSPDFKCVRVDNEVDYERVVDFVHRSQPALVGQVKLYDRDTPMYEEFGIQAEIEKALKPKVWLKSGGFIVINQTEALVAIDVNTGKYVGKTNRLEDTIVKTNIDAVKEIVRQIRLRDLGGIIVIDFIDMDERRNRQKVVQALEEALRFDRAPTNILSINEFGLVALTRKRVKHSLERTLCEPCAYCAGSGWVKSVATVCHEIMGEVRKMAAHIEGKVLNLRVNPEVAKALKSRDGRFISELESLTHKDVVVRSDPTVHQERFEIF